MLSERGIDFRDCLEKADLVDRLQEAISQGKTPTRSSSPQSSLTETEQQVVSTFQRCAKSVAFIQTTQLAQASPLSLRAMEVPIGAGSGFVWDSHGHIVTNYHVVNPPNGNRPRGVKVTLQSGKTSFDAKIVGVEPEKDIAVLKIDGDLPTDLSPIQLGNSADLMVGQTVLAIGNPFGLDYTLTTGVVSALGREVMGVGNRPIKGCVQTDAAINPGNSGGPLLDSRGHLIGVNTAIYSPSGASAGIGFAIPVDTVRRVVNQLIRFGRVQRAVLGAQVYPDQLTLQISEMLGQTLPGVLVQEVTPGSPAAMAGLLPTMRNSAGQTVIGDVITAVNDVQVKEVEDLLSALEEYNAGDSVRISVMRGSKNTSFNVKLQERNQLKELRARL